MNLGGLHPNRRQTMPFNDIVITKCYDEFLSRENTMATALDFKRETLNIRIKPEERNLPARETGGRGHWLTAASGSKGRRGPAPRR